MACSAAMRLVTARLVLREFVEADWPAVLAYQSDPRYLRYYAWRERDEPSVRAFVGALVALQHEQPRRKFQLAVTLPAEGGRLIGNCGLRIDDAEGRQGNIGYELDPRYWGRGYATEAARAMVALGFERFGLHRIWSWCVADNTASAHVLEKLGMRREGHLREREYYKGRWWDQLIYAVLDREWPTRPPADAP
jgi:ribosomal-protein-alanine N-acetyltransferase